MSDDEREDCSNSSIISSNAEGMREFGSYEQNPPKQDANVGSVYPQMEGSTSMSESSISVESEKNIGPEIDEQRKLFQKISDDMLASEEKLVFIVPKAWIDQFMNDPGLSGLSFDELKRKLGSINTASLLVDPNDTNVLKHDYNYGVEHQDYTPITNKHWDLLVQWYGMEANSPKIERALIENSSTGTSQIEYQIPIFNLKKLMVGNITKVNNLSNFSHRLLYKNQIVYFSSSRTIGELHDYITMFLQKSLPSEEPIRVRLWHIDDVNMENYPLFLNLTLFKKLQYKKLLTEDLYEKRLFELGMVGGYILLETNDYKNHQFSTQALVKRLGELQQTSTPTDSDDSDSDKDIALTKTPADGKKGLTSLGNSCYMNSALQCLTHVPELAQYFYYNLQDKELNANNPLSKEGAFATVFGALIHQLYDSKQSKNRFNNSITPREFKSTMGQYNNMFYGHQQHDSQEFLAYLLDGLHEDLNRIIIKPYTEKPELPPDKLNDEEAVKELAENCWANHKLRNDSVILDLFVGLYKSTLKCPVCENVSLTFDPYSDLTLPIPITRKWSHKVYILRDDVSYKLQLLECELPKSNTFEDLRSYVAKKLDISSNDLYGFEIFQNQFYKNFQGADSKYMPLSDLISAQDIVVLYEVKNYDSSRDLLVPVINAISDADSSFNSSKPFGLPYFIKLDKTEVKSFGIIREKLESRYNSFTTYNYFSKIRRSSFNSENNKKRKFFKLKDFPKIEKLLEKGNEDNFDAGIREKQGGFKNQGQKKLKVDNADDEFEVLDTEDIPMKSNSQVTGYADDSDYDSEISIANPELSSDRTFEIQLFEGGSNRFKYSVNIHETYEQDNRIWVPASSGLFSNLEKLIDKLPLNKKLFYSYNNEEDSELQDVATKEESLEENPVLDNNPDVIDMNDELMKKSLQPIHLGSDRFSSRSSSVDERMSVLFLDKDSLLSSDSENEAGSKLALEATGSIVDNHPVLLKPQQALLCQWNQESYKEFFKSGENGGGQSTLDEPELISNPELEESRKLRELENKNLTLDDCLKSFSKLEILGQNDLWYCPKCKDHREAEKQIELWSTPDILTIHFKRFESQRRYSDKIDAVIDFPIEGLDLSQYVVNSDINANNVYDLFAVDNHFGSLGGGHYTAYARNFVDNQWYYYDDSLVSATDAKKAIASSAYLLFYRRRTSKNLGGESLEKLITQARLDEEAKLQIQRSDEIKNIQEIVRQIKPEKNISQESKTESPEMTKKEVQYDDADSQ